jgi:hypothetical protein
MESYMASNELMLQGSGFSKFSNEISFKQGKMGGFFYDYPPNSILKVLQLYV